MPYIITTIISDDTLPARAPLSRQAVATLEEARRECDRLATEHGASEGTQLWAALGIESGGTVGPLPDGTVIKVEQTEWIALAHALPMEPWPGYDPENAAWRHQILDAFNTREAA